MAHDPRPFMVGYRRVSTTEKLQLSLDDQTDIIQGIAEQLGKRLLRVFTDQQSRGVARDGMQEMLAFVESDPSIYGIGFWHYTRMWGTVGQLKRIDTRARKAGVKLIDGELEEYSLEGAGNKLMGTLRGALSEFEVDQSTERLYATQKKKAERGKMLMRPPFGLYVEYYLDEDQQRRGRYMVDDEKLGWLRQALHHYVDDGWSCYKICQWLMANNVPTPGGKQAWSVVQLRRMFDNPIYIGDLVWNKRKTVWEEDPYTGDKVKSIEMRPASEWVHAPSPFGVLICDDEEEAEDGIELWQKAQALMTAKGKEVTKKVYGRRLFDSSVRCDRCGKRMHPRRDSHKLKDGSRAHSFRYACAYRNGGTRCATGHQIAESKLLAALRTVADTEAPLVTGKVEFAFKPDPRLAQEIEQLDQRLAESDVQWQNVRKANRAGLLTLDEMAEDKASIDRERATNEDLLAEARARMAGDSQALAPAIEETRQLLAEMLPLLLDEDEDIEARRAVLLRHIEFHIDHPRIRISWTGPGSGVAAQPAA